MKLEGILSISGKPGLYKLVSHSKNSIIVESLSDNKRFPIYSSHKVSSLEEIGIYTYSDTTPISDVFDTIAQKNDGQPCISHKASKEELAKWMRDILPEYDEEQVYNSDIKKLAQWYNVLHQNGLIDVPKSSDNKSKPSKKSNEKNTEKI